jgi:hypothetical protein
MDYFKGTPLATTTANMYNKRIAEWLSYMPQSHQHVSQIFMFPEFANKILQEHIHTKTNSNLHSFYAPILAVLNHCTEYTSHIQPTQLETIKVQWKEIVKENLKPYEERRMNSLPTENQLQKGGTYTKYEDILKKRDSLSFGSIERLLLGFYTHIPPVRADYFATEIITFKEKPTQPNYIRRISPTDSVLVLNDFKTKNHYKQIKNKLPPELNAELVESLRLQPRNYLFVNQTGQVFTRNSFSKWSQRALSRVFETEMTLNLIRHLFISSLKLDTMTIKEMTDISSRMGHKLQTHLSYRWNVSDLEKDEDSD